MSADEAASTPVDASAAPAPAAQASDSPAAGAEKEAPKSTSSATKKAPASKAKGRPSVGGGNKKGQAAAAAANEKSSYDIGDIVLARLRGYPPWPARIADPETIPRNVLKQRPGKNPSIYCCQFFPAGDYSWLQSKEIKPLSPSDISSWLSEPHRKITGGLRDAYLTAQDPSEWDEEQAEIHRANEEAENAVDELEDEEEEEEPTSGGKRKRAEAPKSKAKSKPAAKPKAEKAKPVKAAAKPDNQETVDEDPLASNPECVKVKDWRHKLQRAFLSKTLPSAEEMPTYDELFKTIESYNAMTIDALQYSKIGKVMKKIVTLPDIPRNEEFKITDRASKLMHQWTDFIASSEPKPNGSASATEVAANGNGNGDAEKKQEEEKAPAEEKKDEVTEAEPEKKEVAAEEKKDGEASKEAAAEAEKKADEGNMDVDA
ncbi:hypothetical protein I317_07247 [Kwoniella heveanensis CBS 569]|nr:hypothetical protein I317_07247 [Kwoniella heveanensis CBS 569]